MGLIKNLDIVQAINNLIEKGVNSTKLRLFIYDHTGLNYTKSSIIRYIRSRKKSDTQTDTLKKKEEKSDTLKSTDGSFKKETDTQSDTQYQKPTPYKSKTTENNNNPISYIL